ncbi:MAG: hypothetical protein ACOWWH_07200 [Eubacteriaceae bacterium]
MNQKICPYCKSKSYSSDVLSKWICPNCGRDLTKIKATIAVEVK